MKKILLFLTLYSAKIFAQSETDCPFAAQKYVHYDGIIESTSFYLPTQYQQLLQNNNAYDRDITHLDNSAKADCFFKTSIHNHDSIKKPFVFVEGISFEKKSPNANTYNLGDYFRQGWYPNPPGSQQECLSSFNSNPQYHGDMVGYSTFNWATLVTGIDAEGYFSGDPLQVQKSPELLNQLCCSGYDICFVDFMSGEAYIESNGEALYSILVKLHDTLVKNNSSEKMVVCGASMGGLVARYAINKLEAEGHTDWVDKFISFDSPQMGANIPLSLQYTLKHLKGLNDDIEDKYKKLTCPSASQLVNYSCLETNLLSPIVYTTPSPSIERTELLSNQYMGWPQHCKKIAISNGSRLGLTTSISHQPGDQVLDVDGIFDIDLYALPCNDNNYTKVFDFDLPLCVLTASPALMTLGITQQSVRVKNTMALDLAPGSFRKDLQEIENSMPNYLTNWFGQSLDACGLNWIGNPANSDRLCFIPLMSSLGIINYENIMKSPYSITQTLLAAAFNQSDKFEDYTHQFTYFDVVYAPASNQTHVEITSENIDWLMQELTETKDIIWHENLNLTSHTFKARFEITAGNNIHNNPICDSNANNQGVLGSQTLIDQFLHCGDVRVLSNEAVFYKSGGFISLEPGFYTEDLAFFQAEIIDVPACYSNNRTAMPAFNVEQSLDAENPLISGVNNQEMTSVDSEKSIKIYPNPSFDFCDINSIENIETLTLSNLMGSIIHVKTVNAHNYRVPTNELANGVYIISIKTVSENLTKKLVVKHD